MNHRKSQHPHPAGHVLLPAAAISGLSLALAAGLELTGVLANLNAGITRIVSRGGVENFPKQLPDWCPWLAAALFSFALAAVILMAAWAPVLSLAAHAPEIAGPWIATVWSGVCALVYTSRHRMPADDVSPSSLP